MVRQVVLFCFVFPEPGKIFHWLLAFTVVLVVVVAKTL